MLAQFDLAQILYPTLLITVAITSFKKLTEKNQYIAPVSLLLLSILFAGTSIYLTCYGFEPILGRALSKDEIAAINASSKYLTSVSAKIEVDNINLLGGISKFRNVGVGVTSIFGILVGIGGIVGSMYWMHKRYSSRSGKSSYWPTSAL